MSSKICIFKAQDLQRFPAANTAPHWLLNRSQADIDFLLQRDSYLKITQWPLSFLYQAIVYYHADLEFLLRYNHREMCAYVAFLQLICNPETVFECPFWHFVICFPLGKQHSNNTWLGICSIKWCCTFYAKTAGYSP